jgi:hypothetical protein
MTTQTKKPSAIFPDFPRDIYATTPERKLTTDWHLGLSALFQALQKNYKNEGILIPVLSDDDQTQIENIYQQFINKVLPTGFPDISGQMIFDGIRYDAGATPRVPKIFVITYNANRTVKEAEWKSFTIT